MKTRSITLLLFLVTTALLTSCQNTEIQTQEMPETEGKWAETLMHWYPDWTPPVVVQKIEQ